MDVLLLIPMLVVVIIVFFYLGWMMNSRIGKKSIITAEEQAKKILDDADKDAKNIKREKLLEVKDEWYKKKTEFDKEVQQKRQKVGALEKQIQLREENSEKKFDLVLQKERENKKFEQDLNQQRKLIENKLEEINR
ncbi:MAG: Rnase Y domain-containing protein, partial [Ignavibacteriaceae bacterium]|nr:Rnase Y domain-containing protein [Ignavibacteriaceae bacterium]